MSVKYGFLSRRFAVCIICIELETGSLRANADATDTVSLLSSSVAFDLMIRPCQVTVEKCDDGNSHVKPPMVFKRDPKSDEWPRWAVRIVPVQ